MEAKSVAVHDDGLECYPSWQESYQSVGLPPSLPQWWPCVVET